MENKKQTAVEWLINELHSINQGLSTMSYNHAFDKAKEMDKQQIIDAHIEGNKTYTVGGVYETVAEQYYIETYGSKGSDEIKTDKL